MVAGFPQSRQLTPVELDKAYRGRFVTGWEFPQLVKDQDISLRILLPKGLPFDAPRVAIYPAPEILTWPHLEENGILCLYPGEVPVTTEKVEDLATDLLRRAQVLVNDCLEGIGFEQFEDEFNSYWAKWHRNNSSKPIVVMCHPGGPSRWVSAWHGKLKIVVADDDATLRSWLKNNWSGDLSSNPTFQPIPLLRLPRPLHPDEYPRTIGMVLSSEVFPAEAKVFFREALAAKEFRHRTVLIEAQSRYGPVFAGLLAEHPGHVKKLAKGYRSMGHVPTQVLADRQRSVAMEAASVDRCDAAWVHGRGHNHQLLRLTGKRVMVLGVGSIGSGVAELLAKAGVGRLDLVDPDTVVPENCSRHSLGLDSYNRYKSTELACELGKKLPHLAVSGHKMTWEQLYEENPDCFAGVDLIISTIGVWKAESRLNVLLSMDIATPPAVVYGWTEPYAAAGHAVALFGGKGCLRCLVTDEGRDLVPVTDWAEAAGTTTRMTASCGGEFQPYGAIELSHIHALIADLALDILMDRVQHPSHLAWIGKKKLQEADAGKWNDEWVARHGDPGNGGCIVDAKIEADPDCIVCGCEATRVAGGNAE